MIVEPLTGRAEIPQTIDGVYALGELYLRITHLRPRSQKGPEMTAKVVLLSLVIGSTLASILLSSAMAAPVTLADVEGRKICWSTGSISSFIAGGNIQVP
jgi:hypothetical protein